MATPDGSNRQVPVCARRVLFEQENCVDVHTVKTNPFTIPKCRLEESEELLNWETGIGS